VARFLGIENVLRGRLVASTRDGIVVDVKGTELQIAANPLSPDARDAWVIFAPEHVELRGVEQVSRSSSRNVIPAKVISVLPREGRVEVSLEAGFRFTAAVTRSAVDALGLEAGAHVVAAIKATAIHVVPA
jgi:molybdopterin-binding protein